jgi:hypothetical protein
MAKKEVKADTKTVPFETSLKCELTEAELLTKGASMADAQEQLANFENEAKTVAGQFKAKIDEQKARLAALASTVRSKAEYRPVKCERTLNYTTGMATEIRLDTCASIGTRELTESEKQLQLEI